MKLQLRKKEKGMALVITLVMLAIVTFMAVVFLAVSRREREGVKISEEQAVSKLMVDSAQAHAEAEMVARMNQAAETYYDGLLDRRTLSTNLQHVFHSVGTLERAKYHYDLTSSRNYQDPLGFRSGVASPENVNYADRNGNLLAGRDALQNLANLQYKPRPPVYVQLPGETTNRFQFYLDINRNGLYDTNGTLFVSGTNGTLYSATNGAPTVNPPFLQQRFTGDPEWIGVLERPDEPHSERNRFVGRYAFIVVPEGKTLDWNYIHNMSATAKDDLVTDGTANDPSSDFQYRRNQGIGPWELNLAGFLVDLHTNIWRPYLTGVYRYDPPLNPNAAGEASGVAFRSAFHLLKHRMNNNRQSFYKPEEIFRTTSWWGTDLIDQHGDGPYIPYMAWYTNRAPLTTGIGGRALLRDDDQFARPWHGLERPEKVKDFAHFQSIYTDAANFTPFFTLYTNWVGQDSTKTNTYDRYTYFRLLSQISTDSKPALENKIHLNHPFPIGTISTNIGAETNAWIDTRVNFAGPLTNFFMIAAEKMLQASIVTNVFLETIPDINGYPVLVGWQTNYTVGGPYYPANTDWNTNWAEVRRRPINVPVRKEISVTNIQIYSRPTGQLTVDRSFHGRTNNEYTPAVHRILQLAANIYDNMTNQTVFPYDAARGQGDLNQLATPTVFRPTFTRAPDSLQAQGWVRINNWVVETNAAFISNTNRWRKVDGPGGFWDSPSVNGNTVMIYGQPVVIGVKKGWPNFNELSIETHAQVTRKLAAYRPGGRIDTNIQFRQMFVLGISNVFAIEAWNSYAQRLKRGIELRAEVRSDLGLHVIRPNAAGIMSTTPVRQATYVTATNNFRIPANPGWPGRQSTVYSNEVRRARVPDNPAPEPETDFRIPIYSEHVFLTNENYVVTGPGNVGIPFFTTNASFSPIEWETNSIPDFLLMITNRVRYVAIDLASDRIIDVVTLDKLTTHLRLREALLSTINAGQAATGGAAITNQFTNPGIFWDNTPSQFGPYTMPAGLAAQLLVSIGEPPIPDAIWRTFSVLPPGNDKDRSIDYFRQFLGMYPLNPTNEWRNAAQSRDHQAPFSPTRRLYIHTKYQANDPLVHFTKQDLMFPGDLDVFGVSSTNGGTRVQVVTPGLTPRNDDLGRVNQKYNQWAGWVDPWIKDPGVHSSDDWDFTSARYDTNRFNFRYASVGSLGSIHRGTPWQSVYLKAGTVATTNWHRYSGLYHSEPYRDWRLLDLFTAAPIDTSTRGLLSVNQANAAAWSAVLSGVQVVTNTVSDNEYRLNQSAPKRFDDMFILPGSPQMSNIVKSINAYRATRPMGVFAYMGEVLGAPALSYFSTAVTNVTVPQASPFLNVAGTNQLRLAFTDEVMEKIPRQILGLLKADEPRFTIYAFGQSLRPAPRSLSTDGDFYNLCQNYQVTGEYAAKAVVRVEGEVKNPANPLRTVVEKFEPLPPLD